MPYHVILDTAGETKLGKQSIGTTRRGIGPCYADKASRLGIRVQDLLDEKILRKKIMAAMEPKRPAAAAVRQGPELDLHTMTEEYLTYGHRLEPHIADTAHLCWEALDSGATVLFEGAQATLLDLDHGTYPFVTSSNPIAGAACVGAGVGPADIDEVWGIAKAYSTRVGAGPFPTELDDETGELLRERGGEFGTTTGRPRRCGWLDLVGAALRGEAEHDERDRADEARRARRHQPAQGLQALPHPDGAVFDEFPWHQSILHSVEPEYEELPGFEGEIGDCRSEADLPREARDYLEAIPTTRRAGEAGRRRPGPRPDRLDRRRAGAEGCLTPYAGGGIKTPAPPPPLSSPPPTAPDPLPIRPFPPFPSSCSAGRSPRSRGVGRGAAAVGASRPRYSRLSARARLQRAAEIAVKEMYARWRARTRSSSL